jgi:uncharacterized membrane protein YgdD (TMEM256/DUF423 family)
MDKVLLALTGAMGFLAVALGAFGSHGLKRFLAARPDAEDRRGWWQTAAQYHLAHALALGVAACFVARAPLASTAAWLFTAGILLFSGSLYAMTLTGIRKLGAVTPVGGLLLLGGWVVLGTSAL